MIHANITFRVGKLFIHFHITSTLFMKEKNKLKSIKAELQLINQGLIRNNIENLPIDNLIIKKETLIISIPLNDIHYINDTYIELKTLNFKFNDCSINLIFDHQPYSFQELSQKPVEFNIGVAQYK